MQISPEVLRQKGWSEEEISHAQQLLKRAELEKKPGIAKLERAVFWALLALTVGGVFAVSLVLVPLLLFLDDLAISAALALLGMSLGALYSIVVKDIEWLEHLHHTVSGIMLIAIACANVWVIVSVMNRFAASYSFGQIHNPVPLAIVFTLALIAPFTHHLLADWWHGSTHAAW